MSLFSGFKRKKTVVQRENFSPKMQEMNIEPSTVQPESPNESDSEAYFFENPLEMVIYGKLFCPQKTVYWKSGNNYIIEHKKGYALFEQQKYAQAIEVYENCLRLNPIGISARFEICESYLQLHKFSEARRTLLAMQDFLVEEKNIARFYRRMGYIEIEEGRFKTAAACYIYSRQFENHQSIGQELQYISVKGRINVSSINAESVLTEASIPLLTKKNFE